MPLERLALELVGLRANVLPVAGGRVGLTYFVDQSGEVPQAGDRHGRLAVEHRDAFAGTAEPDGSLELFQRDPTGMSGSHWNYGHDRKCANIKAFSTAQVGPSTCTPPFRH